MLVPYATLDLVIAAAVAVDAALITFNSLRHAQSTDVELTRDLFKNRVIQLMQWSDTVRRAVHNARAHPNLLDQLIVR